ncbi:MAG: hypothetical protein ABR532_05805 [Candidatus Dormibacteria bacterium]
MTGPGESARVFLEALYRRIGPSSFTLEAVVEAARPEESPIHGHFTWDDTAAAHERRLDQAASLVRMVHISRVTDAGELRVRMFHAERDVRPSATPRTYVHWDDVKDDSAMIASLSVAMERDWKAFERRWSHVAAWRDFILGKADELREEETA